MTEFLKPLSSAKILVIGDVILDRYLHGDTQRISPEAPVPVVKVEQTEERPGGAANVAMNIRALGVGVVLMGVTGKDKQAENLTQLLKKEGVDCNFVIQDDLETVTKVRVMSRHQQLIRLDYENNISQETAATLLESYRKCLKKFDLVVLSDYAKGSLSMAREYIESARSLDIPVFVDPKGDDFSRYTGASYITPNMKEFEAVAGPCNSDTELVERARAMCDAYSLSGLLVTRGEKGMTAVDFTGSKDWHIPTVAHEVFDVTGAGDTVIATLAAAIVSDYPLSEAVNFANLAAGMVVEKSGTASISHTELNKKIRTLQPIKDGSESVVEISDLLREVESAREAGKRIVMTNGCFDILHAGHVEYLEKAREKGDCLIVALNDDDSVRRLKGEKRPINKQGQRAKILAALSSTTWITLFSEDTPEKLIEQINPEVLVKGADYKISEIAGAEYIKARGGEVVTIPFDTDCSTTEIINSINSTS